MAKKTQKRKTLSPAELEARHKGGEAFKAKAEQERARRQRGELTWEEEIKAFGPEAQQALDGMRRDRNFDAAGFYKRILQGEIDCRLKDAAGQGRVGIGTLVPRPWQRQLSRELIRWRLTQKTRWMELVVKSRQLGFSTYWDAMLWTDGQCNPGAGAAITAQDPDTLMALQRNFRVFTKQDKSKGLAKRAADRLFETPEGSYVRLVGADENMLKGDSPRHIHVSEADYVEGLETALQSALPAIERTQFATVVLETTIKRSMSTEFKDFIVRSRKGYTDYRIRFLSWVQDDEAVVSFTEAEAAEFMASIDSLDNQAREYEQMLRDKLKLSAGQIAFWRQVLRQDAGGNIDAAIEIMPTTLDEALASTQRAEFLYQDSLDWIKTTCREPEERYKTSNDGLMLLSDPRDFGEAHLQVWSPPEAGEPYFIGADIADENNRAAETGSENYAFVIHGGTGEQVAEWSGDATAPEFATALNEMGLWYNNALIIPERNVGLGVITHLYDNLNYWNVYEENPGSGVRGFFSSATTRPLLVERVQDAVNNKKVLIRSKKLLEQLVDFAKRRGRPQKKQGAGGVPDDGVIAFALSMIGHGGLTGGLWRSWDKREAPRPRQHKVVQARTPKYWPEDDDEDDVARSVRRGMNRT